MQESTSSTRPRITARAKSGLASYLSHRRDEFYLATKCGCNIDAEGNRLEPGHLWTAKRLHTNIDQSLRRLKTDCVDLLQMHNPTVEDVEQGGLIQVLEDIRQAGKTRFIGVSSTGAASGRVRGVGGFDAFQIPYSALERQHERMIQEAADAGAGIVIRGGISLGHRANEERQSKWEQAKLDELIGGDESPRVYPALHPRTSSMSHDDCRHDKPRAHEVQCRCGPSGSTARGSLRGSKG